MGREKNSQKIIIEQLSHDLEDLAIYLKDLWQFLPLPTLYANPLFVILDVNSALEKLFGLKAMELIGEKVEILFKEKLAAKRILEEVSKKKKIENKEIEVATKEGRKILSISASSRQDEEGNIIGHYFSFFDISILKELQERLEEKVKERTKELQEKIDQLEIFQRLTVGRELKMIELKREIEKLKAQLERSKKR
jgi:PAS domain S-box-containing protein